MTIRPIIRDFIIVGIIAALCWRSIIAGVQSKPLAEATTMLVLAGDGACLPEGLDPNVVPFAFEHDPADYLLPLWPGDPSRWDLPLGTWTRPAALSCHAAGLSYTVTCEWWTCPTKPAVIHDETAGTWSTIIEITEGIYKAVYRTTDSAGVENDFEIVWRGVNPGATLR